MTDKANRLIWLDLEMSGLSITKNRIIEIATIVTDDELNIIAEGPSLAIYQPPEVLNKMDDWNTHHHNTSGLVKRVEESKLNETDAENKTLAFLEQYVKPKTSPMCGNSICTDRFFLHTYMPRLEAFFHYRQIDVSTMKELARRWAPSVYEGHTKSSPHLALEDIRESIDELRYYRQHFVLM
jgi:oligoribonuclease